MEIQNSQIGDLVIEGKTKKVHKLVNVKHENGNLVYILSKDRISAGDGARAHDLKGKAKLSTQTNCALFEFLNGTGVRTHFVSRINEKCENSDVAFIAKECGMIPIEFVCRRVATGSFLRRMPHVKEGYRFAPPKLETFFKDDANHDPFWSYETLIEAKLEINGLLIEKEHVDEMYKLTQTIFELLERVWQTENHSLIDMKIEFGVVDENGKKTIVLGDVIDNDSWRLWPNGDKRLMLDKQIYRNLDINKIDDAALQAVKSKFEIVAERTQRLFGSVLPKPLVDGEYRPPRVGIVLGSLTDKEHAEKIKSALAKKYAIHEVEIHVCSAHKSTNYALEVLSKFMQWPSCQVVIACAGRSNGLGPVAAANSTIPVINCPPMSDNSVLGLDIWSSIRLPSGMGCGTVLGPENAAQCAAHIIANNCPLTWSKIKVQQSYTIIKMLHDDAALNK